MLGNSAMALIENSLPLHLPNLHLHPAVLRNKVAKEALKGAYWYQAAMNPAADLKDMSVEDLLGVASIHYRRRQDTDWFEGPKEHPVP